MKHAELYRKRQTKLSQIRIIFGPTMRSTKRARVGSARDASLSGPLATWNLFWFQKSHPAMPFSLEAREPSIAQAGDYFASRSAKVTGRK